ncbi:C4-dicarboxylate ABC transporter permease [Virgibacillus profundi]|uniref:C4-dicarboxylate ABC transporter permease n=1 Tax=Virgibacillus profundi TaxID=2024555 RepID=A0A2A2IIJ3_9BACI|nr:TRAP transporter permease [Virgibacillus profundi]PAV31084.1 C4-dicarboxylate ABC transporter permease [Virgibacillus profundi]PXY55267.1 C4-dicarboxylate ABC transporter permease [Virgibacillus profundi]
MSKHNKKLNQNIEVSNQSKYRNFNNKFWKYLIFAIAVSLSIFHLYSAGFGSLLAIKFRAVHIGVIMILIFLLIPHRNKKVDSNLFSKYPSIFDVLLALLSGVTIGYIFYFYDDVILRGGIANQTEIILGTIFLLLILEAARRSVGWALPLLAVIFFLYGLYGEWIPGPLNHANFSYRRMIEQMYISTEGIFGIALGVSAQYIFLFILFGAFMSKTGMGQLITDMSLAVSGKKAGGPAKVAVIASSTMGTINGAAVANVVTTGSFTIPLMKKIGFKPVFAGSVEAVASAGGQIVPPVMGAAAFILAELTGISYATVMIAAIVPAFLYYFSTWIMIDREAKRLNLRGLNKEELPSLKETFIKRGHMIIPLVIVVSLIVYGLTPIYAAFFGIVSIWIVSFLRKETKLTFKEFMLTLEEGSKGALSVAAACAVVGIIIGVVSLTGLGVSFTSIMLDLTHGQLPLLLLLTMLSCIILGMGLPTSAAYIMAGTVAAPVLIATGVEVLAAHLFVFYFATLSTLTPPVALASYAAAGIANASPSKVGWAGFRLAIAGFIIPFAFVYNPSLILIEGGIDNILISLFTAMFGIFLIAASVIGHYVVNLSMLNRTILFICGILLISSILWANLVGILVGLFILFVLNKQKSSIQTNSLI